MRVVFYSSSTTLYGAPTSLLNLIQGLVKKDRKIQIYVVIPSDGPLFNELEKLPITVIKIPFARWVYKKAMYRDKQKTADFIAKLWFFKNSLTKFLLNLVWLPVHLIRVSRIKPDIIYTNSSMSPVGPVVARVLGVMSIWHHRETINDPVTDFFLEWNEQLAVRILNWPQIHIHPSQFLESTYAPYVNSGTSFVVYNGVENGRPDFKERNRSEPTAFGMVGRINRQKGQEEVIKIFSTEPDTVLNLYGTAEASYLDRLKKVANQNVIFQGYQSKEAIYSEIDFLIVNALNESFGRVVAEAFAYGLPVLARRSGALVEIIEEGKTGFFFNDYNDLGVLISKLKRIRSTDEFRNMQAACFDAYHNKFSIPKYSSSILEIMASATGK